MVFDLYIILRKIILNVKQGMLTTPTHFMKRTKYYTSSVCS